MPSDHSCSSSVTTMIVDGGALSTVHPEIIGTHILTKLDGPTLASAYCVSTLFQSLCAEENLWRNICNASWPSIKDPRVSKTISTFPSGYRSFFCNSLPSLHHNKIRYDHNRLPSGTTELISAVDIHYKGQPVYSKVIVTDTSADEFWIGPTWVDPMNPRERMSSNSVKFGIIGEELMSRVAEHMTLSWIVIDPTRKLAGNLSSLRPVLVEAHWLSGHMRLLYSTLLTMTGDQSEAVEFRITVTCEVNHGGEGMKVIKLNLEGLDMDGKTMKWKDSLVILQEAMECGRRERGKEREGYIEYLKMQRDRRKKEWRREIDGTIVIQDFGYWMFVVIFFCFIFVGFFVFIC